MAVRANYLEINDLENGIRHCKEKLEHLRLFEMGQLVSKKEKKEVAEERRKINLNLQFFVEQVVALENQNKIITCIYFLLLISIIFLRCMIFTPERVELKRLSGRDFHTNCKKYHTHCQYPTARAHDDAHIHDHTHAQDTNIHDESYRVHTHHSDRHNAHHDDGAHTHYGTYAHEDASTHDPPYDDNGAHAYEDASTHDPPYDDDGAHAYEDASTHDPRHDGANAHEDASTHDPPHDDDGAHVH